MFLSANSILAKVECEQFCTRNFDPICAGPSGSEPDQWQTFSNDCDLRVHNCENQLSKNLFFFSNIMLTDLIAEK